MCAFEHPLLEYGTNYDIVIFYSCLMNDRKTIVWDLMNTLETCGVWYEAKPLDTCGLGYTAKPIIHDNIASNT